MIGRIEIDTERCKGCGLCVQVCPQDVIVISKRSNKKGYFPAEAANPGCIGCALCAQICPDAAIKVYQDKTAPTLQIRQKSKSIITGTSQKRFAST
ncbi:MAG: 4Fe-4S binding protein [Sedimentisphaerales bacterium]|nr:4Fe-4S binding protein [Sedimentisphaerales bacterium]